MESKDNFYVGQLLESWQNSPMPWRKNNLRAADDVRAAVEPLVLLDAARLFVAMAADYLGLVQRRNDRADVNDALAALRTALAKVNAIDDSLDG